MFNSDACPSNSLSKCYTVFDYPFLGENACCSWNSSKLLKHGQQAVCLNLPIDL